MNILLWIVQGLLALMFLSAGMMKVFQYEKAKASLPWVKDSSKSFVTFVGLAELLGAIGLVLPLALNVMPVLTPVAALALAAVMLFAAIFHARRAEYKGIGMNVILLALLLLVFFGRL